MDLEPGHHEEERLAIITPVLQELHALIHQPLSHPAEVDGHLDHLLIPRQHRRVEAEGSDHEQVVDNNENREASQGQPSLPAHQPPAQHRDPQPSQQVLEQIHSVGGEHDQHHAGVVWPHVLHQAEWHAEEVVKPEVGWVVVLVSEVFVPPKVPLSCDQYEWFIASFILDFEATMGCSTDN